MDLANSRADTDTLLGQKIRDLTLEVHDLREKLQSGEENKIMLKRINTEFKFRIEKQQEAEVALVMTSVSEHYYNSLYSYLQLFTLL